MIYLRLCPLVCERAEPERDGGQHCIFVDKT
jgi:hypothetical protein